jgi:hypothetical protein
VAYSAGQEIPLRTKTAANALRANFAREEKISLANWKISLAKPFISLAKRLISLQPIEVVGSVNLRFRRFVRFQSLVFRARPFRSARGPQPNSVSQNLCHSISLLPTER